jgi:hypothetical protein
MPCRSILKSVEKELKSYKDDGELFRKIVNCPLNFKLEVADLSLGIIVLLLVSRDKKTIDRIALSDNELAEGTKKMSAKKFEDIKIPVGFDDNIIAKAISRGKPYSTTDWQYLFIPNLTPQEARFNQAGGSIGFSAVFPFKARQGGALIFSYYQYQENIGAAQYTFMEKYTKLVSDALSNKN